jgi:hypothetical protein
MQVAETGAASSVGAAPGSAAAPEGAAVVQPEENPSQKMWSMVKVIYLFLNCLQFFFGFNGVSTMEHF